MEKIEEADQNTPDLSQIMAEGRPMFDGVNPDNGVAPVISVHKPGPDAENAEEGADGGKAGEEEAAGGKAGEEKADGNKPGQEAAGGKKPEAEEASGEKPGEEATDQEKTGEIVPRFKSHDEAEKGYKNLLGKTTKAEQRAAALEEENRLLKEERDREKNAEQAATEASTVRKKVVEYAKTRKKTALAEIDKLDPDQEDYQDRAAEILAEEAEDIAAFRQTNSVLPAVAPEKPAAEKKETTSEEAAAGDDVAAQDEAQRTAARDAVVKKIGEAGIEAEDPLFWTYANLAPTKDEKGNPLKIDQQIDWAVEQTKTYHQRLQDKVKKQTEEEAGKKGLQHQEEALPLGRGGTLNGKIAEAQSGKDTGKEEAGGLNAAIDAALEQRRL